MGPVDPATVEEESEGPVEPVVDAVFDSTPVEDESEGPVEPVVDPVLDSTPVEEESEGPVEPVVVAVFDSTPVEEESVGPVEPVDPVLVSVRPSTPFAEAVGPIISSSLENAASIDSPKMTFFTLSTSLFFMRVVFARIGAIRVGISTEERSIDWAEPVDPVTEPVDPVAEPVDPVAEPVDPVAEPVDEEVSEDDKLVPSSELPVVPVLEETSGAAPVGPSSLLLFRILLIPFVGIDIIKTMHTMKKTLKMVVIFWGGEVTKKIKSKREK